MATQQIHHWLNAVWAVVAEANRYFAGEAPWRWPKPIRRVSAPLFVRDRRSRQADRHSDATGHCPVVG